MFDFRVTTISPADERIGSINFKDLESAESHAYKTSLKDIVNSFAAERKLIEQQDNDYRKTRVPSSRNRFVMRLAPTRESSSSKIILILSDFFSFFALNYFRSSLHLKIKRILLS